VRGYHEAVKSRVAGLIIVIVVVLAVLAVRLWTMQVIHGQDFLAQATANRTRTATTPAPRGRILDRNGVELVTNRSSMVVLAPAKLADDEELVERLADVLEMRPQDIIDRVSTVREAPLDLRVVAVDVPVDTISYLAERATEFPGIEVDARAVREYPKGALGAHVLGYTGAISQQDLDGEDFQGYFASDIVGKTGAERSFERVLQGVRGTRVLEVNASGSVNRIIQDTAPVPGQDVVLTIDVSVQEVAEQALLDALSDARKKDFTKVDAAAAVAIDIRNGDVLAMANYPSYDPGEFLGGISQERWEELTSKESNYPLTNRAMMSVYPPASTFKAFTALAALEEGFVNQNTTTVCTGRWAGYGEPWGKWCWDHSGHGTQNLRQALENSCDTYFYEAGMKLDAQGEESVQRVAREFGYGSRTGIDLPGEAPGRMPDAAWKKAWNEDYPEYQQWVPGDTINIMIGQGDVLASPLQVAVSFASLANDGVAIKPHVFKSVRDSAGNEVIAHEPEVLIEANVSAAAMRAVRGGLEAVISTGTGRGAFIGLDTKVAGKTGTAEMNNQDDYAWFVGYAPADNPQYAVAVVVEQGGSGGGVAAPAVRQIIAALMGLEVEHVSAEDRSR